MEKPKRRAGAGSPESPERKQDVIDWEARKHLGDAIAAIRNKEELFRVITEKINPLFGFDDAIVLTLTANGKHRLLMTRVGAPTSGHSVFQSLLEKEIDPQPSTDWLLAADEPRILELQLLLDRFPGNPSLERMEELGLRQLLVAPLRVGGRKIGLLNLNSRRTDAFTPHRLPLFQSLADQLALAVANILANEALEEKARTIAALNQQLMDINNAVTPFRTREQIMQIVGEQLRKIVAFDSYYITRNAYQLDFSNFLFLEEGLHPAIRQHPEARAYILAGTHERPLDIHSGKPVNEDQYDSYPAKGFLYRDLHEDLLKGYPIARIEKELGFQSAATLPLRVNNRAIGHLILSSFDPSSFPPEKIRLLEKLAEPIAIGVSNVLLYEEMQAAKAEIEALNQQLMDINNAVTPFRTREQIMKIIGDQMRKIARFDSYYITHFSKDGNRYALFLEGLLPDIKDDHRIREFLQRGELVALNLEGERISHDHHQALTIQVLRYEDLHQEFLDNYPIAKVEKEKGMKEVLVLPLRLNGQTIGALCLCSSTAFTLQKGLFQLLEKLAEPIAIGVSNVLLYEEMQAAKAEIEAREREKSLQIAVTNAILGNTIWNDRALQMAKALRNFIPWDMFAVSFQFQQVERELALTYLMQPDGEIVPQTHEDFFARTNLKEEEYSTMLAEFAEQLLGEAAVYEQPVYDHIPSRLHQLVIKSYGFHSGLYLPIDMDHFGKAWFILASRNGHTYQQHDLDLLKKISPGLSLVLTKVYTRSILVQSERDKSMQVSVINALTSARHRADALNGLAAAIDQYIPCDYFDIAFLGEGWQKGTYSYRKEANGKWTVWNAIAEVTALGGWDDHQHAELSQELAAYLAEPGICTGADHDALADGNAIAAVCRDHFGYRSALRVPFQFKGQPTATLLYLASKNAHGFTPQQLEQVLRLVPSLAIALENIFAFEDIGQREKEKTLLLNLTNSIANIKDKHQFWEALIHQLRPVFRFDPEYNFLYLLTPDKKHYRFFLVNKTALENAALPFRDGIQKTFSIDGVPYEKVLQRSVWIFNIEDEQQHYPYFEGFKQSLEHGIRQTAIVRLEHGGEIIGSLHLNSTERDLFHPGQVPLLEAIGRQVSIAVANILANEEIERQLAEIKKLQRQVEAEKIYLQEEVKNLYNFDEIIGNCESLQDALEKTATVARTEATVLLLGETGTGKELFARAIHNLSPRNKKTLIKVNCAALPAQLVESELFGHERGSFTGAFDRRIGKFEIAHQSTLFLDEVGELPLDLQAKLLRAIQEKEFERLGSNKTIHTDVRIIAATNRDLEKEVMAGRFRPDLYFRLNVFPITLPSLRDRREDIPLLVSHFIEKFAKKLGKHIQGISTQALEALIMYSYPGNIRELEHIIERSAILSKTSLIRDVFLPNQQKTVATGNSLEDFRVKTHEENEREYILKVVKKCKGRIAGPGCAAELLGLPVSTLNSKMRKLGIRREHIVAAESGKE